MFARSKVAFISACLLALGLHQAAYAAAGQDGVEKVVDAGSNVTESESFTRQTYSNPVIGAYWVDSCINSYGTLLCDEGASNTAAQAYCSYIGAGRWATWAKQCEGGNHSTMRQFTDQSGSRFVFCPNCTCHFTSIGCD